MATLLDKRRRNARPSKYRPRTPAQKRRQRDLREARSDERKARQVETEEERLAARLAALDAALRDLREAGVHRRRHARRLDEITDDAERVAVLKARVERLEALWAIDRRRRQTRGKIIIGGAMLAELIDATAAGDSGLLVALLDILDRRVDAARDRLTVRELLGGAPLPLRPTEEGGEGFETGPDAVFRDAPDFDAMVQSAMAEESVVRPGEIDVDDVDLGPAWRAYA